MKSEKKKAKRAKNMAAVQTNWTLSQAKSDCTQPHSGFLGKNMPSILLISENQTPSEVKSGQGSCFQTVPHDIANEEESTSTLNKNG